MGKIVLLDENTSNKIAAGEVVERPASVIKELVENSIDAGATNINVEVKNGGISLMRISDNGSGIDEDDVEIAFERHATSKIRSADELESISTLGFRGEALASIASVSIVELTTRTQKNSYGIYARVEGGTLKEIKQTGCPVGTTFVVSSLFYNTPARYKFLKKDSTEFSYISEIINRIALAKPQISFKLAGNNSIVLHTPGNNDLLSVIFSIYGKEVSKNLTPISFEDSLISIKGYAGKPEISRSTRDYQSIFINGRYIKSKLISAAIDEAYKTFVMKNKFPFAVLNLQLNPMLVDVNVHPTKMEVRFSNEQEIFRSIYHALNNALLSTPLIRNVQFIEKDENIFKIKNQGHKNTEYVQQNLTKSGINYNNSTSQSENFNVASENNLSKNYKLDNQTNKDSLKYEEPSFKESNFNESNFKESNFNEYNNKEPDIKESDINKNQVSKADNLTDFKVIDDNLNNIQKNNSLVNDIKESSEDQTDNIKESILGSHNKASEKYDTNQLTINTVDGISTGKVYNGTNNIKEASGNFINSNIIGQIFSTYILLQKDNNLLLIDQHAAHERIMYEYYKEKFKKQDPFTQMLLTPVVIELQYSEIKMIEDKKEVFNNLGFNFDEFGNNSIIIRSVPFINDTDSVKELFLEIIDKIKKSNSEDVSLIADEAIYTIACKSAVKANKKLDEKEINAILEKLDRAENPYTCPHGRPVIVKLTKYELEKMFKRIL
ncbi:MAG: DNA mismatch repair endonuclease MutL [Bacillota bacterium]|nr:DNA mismatch repair endonuclease MutL [Bacillota bacterium]